MKFLQHLVEMARSQSLGSQENEIAESGNAKVTGCGAWGGNTKSKKAGKRGTKKQKNKKQIKQELDDN